jgi:alpha-glucoside transport system permease protein
MSQQVAVPPTSTVESSSRRFSLLRRGAPSEQESEGPKAGWLVKIVVLIICLLWVIPTLGVFITSFRKTDDANSSGWWHVFLSPQNLTRLTLKNYHEALTGQADIGTAFVNSFAITLPATIIPILFAAFAAYAFTFMEFRGRDLIFLVIVSLLVVPNQVAFLPMLKLYGNLGINGTFAAVWLFHASFAMPLAIYILRNYMATLPRAIAESAKIDGASHFQTFWRLIVPMSVPALASFAIFQFLWVWNDLLVALIFIGSGPNQPLPIAVSSLLGQQGQGWQLLTAGGFIMMLVPMAVFLSLQRYFVRGLTSGSVKG